MSPSGGANTVIVGLEAGAQSFGAVKVAPEAVVLAVSAASGAAAAGPEGWALAAPRMRTDAVMVKSARRIFKNPRFDFRQDQSFARPPQRRKALPPSRRRRTSLLMEGEVPYRWTAQSRGGRRA
jgi:hypothetical protein